MTHETHLAMTRYAAVLGAHAVASAIVTGQSEQRHRDELVLRYVVARFLERFARLAVSGRVDLRGTIADLEVGEIGVVEYLEELRAQALRGLARVR